MKKLTSISLIIMLMIVLGITSLAEARTGSTSDSSSSKSRTTTTSSSSTSRPTKTTSKTDSIFANIAKTNEAKKAWQERNKKVVEPTVVANIPAPVQDHNDTKQQLDAIQRQIADAKRQQQMIAIAQTAAQLAINNNNKHPPVTPIPSTTTTAPVSTVPNTGVAETEPAKSGGTSWFMIFLMLGGVVLVIVWFRKRNSSNTIYRL